MTAASSASRLIFLGGMDGPTKENTVQYPRIQPPPRNRVMAVFETSAAVFELPRAATVADLAGRLARLSEDHNEALTSVDMRVGFAPCKEEAAPPNGSVR